MTARRYYHVLSIGIMAEQAGPPDRLQSCGPDQTTLHTHGRWRGSPAAAPSPASASEPMTQDPRERSPSRALQLAAQEIRRRLNDSTPLDSLVLEMAQQQLRLEELAAEVRALSAQLLIRDLVLPLSAEQYRGSASVAIDAGMPLDGEAGFYPLEYDDLGQSFRWTGPEPVFRFDLHLDRSGPLEFLLVLNAGSGERPEETRAFCDGAEIPCDASHQEPRLVLSGVLPPREVLGLTRLYFQPPRMFCPSELGTSSDDRVLGLVFRELRVGPLSDDEARLRLSRRQTLRSGGSALRAPAVTIAPPAVVAETPIPATTPPAPAPFPQAAEAVAEPGASAALPSGAPSARGTSSTRARSKR